MALDNQTYADQLRNAGPRAQPLVQRSAYLSDALKSLEESARSTIKTPTALWTNLLADGIMKYGQYRNNKKIKGAQAADLDEEMQGVVSALQPKPADAPPIAPVTSSAPDPGPSMAPALQPGPQAAADPKRLDMLARLLIGEAGREDDRGQQSVAEVVLNRANQSGLSPEAVMTAPHQFEPFQNPTTRARLDAIDPSAPEYVRALRNATAALGPDDPTQGADHFYSPKAQAALGRPPPAWDNGKGVDYGGHRFFSLGWRGQPGQQAAGSSMPHQPPPALAPQNGSFQVASTGQTPFPASPPSPQGPGMAQAPPPVASPAGGGGPRAQGPQVTPQELQLYQQWMQSGDERKVDAARAWAMKKQLQAASPPSYDIQVVNGVAFRIDPAAGQAIRVDTPGSQSHPGSPQEATGLTPGTAFDVGPNGARNVLQSPPQGYEGPGGAAGPVARGPADPNNPTARLEGLKSLRGEIKPVVDSAISLRRNYSAVQTGYAQQNGAGDIAMVNGLQKMIDEGVVREGDVALQLNAQGIQGGIAGVMSYLNSSGKFDEAIRAKLLKTADSLYGNINSTYRDRVMGYRGIAERTYGQGAFNDVLPPETASALGWNAAPDQQQAQPHPAAVPAAAPSAPQGADNRGYTEAQISRAREIVKARGNSQVPLGQQMNPYAPRTSAAYDAIPPGGWFIDDDGLLVQKGRR